MRKWRYIKFELYSHIAVIRFVIVVGLNIEVMQICGLTC
jgi:hypothetical protein